MQLKQESTPNSRQLQLAALRRLPAPVLASIRLADGCQQLVPAATCRALVLHPLAAIPDAGCHTLHLAAMQKTSIARQAVMEQSS
jgi:hypothetical protein